MFSGRLLTMMPLTRNCNGQGMLVSVHHVILSVASALKGSWAFLPLCHFMLNEKKRDDATQIAPRVYILMQQPLDDFLEPQKKKNVFHKKWIA